MISFYTNQSVQSLGIGDRSLAIASAIPSALTTHTFTYVWPSSVAVGSVVYEYCTNNPLIGTPCTIPSGLDLTSASLDAQSLNTGFSVDVGNSSSNRLVLTRAPVAGIVGTTTHAFGSIINPATANQTVYVRVTTHASTDGSGSYIDRGGLAFSTSSSGLSVGVYVPPFLIFCVGRTVSIDCTSTEGALVSLGELKYTSTVSATTQFSAATNDPTGYDVYVSGQTMTSGNNVIDPITSQAASQVGQSQFGMNMRSNSNPIVGADLNGAGTGTPSSSYNTPNLFKFTNGDLIASSPISTQFNRYTVSYIVNVPEEQPPGFYAATLTYTAVASF